MVVASGALGLAEQTAIHSSSEPGSAEIVLRSRSDLDRRSDVAKSPRTPDSGSELEVLRANVAIPPAE